MIEDKKKLQNTVKELLEGKFPGFEKEWNKFSKSIGEKFVETITEYFTDGNYFMSQLLPHSLSVVIDNNFIFGQIKTMVRDKKPLQDSFIYKLCELSFIEINAPYKLQEELKAKIDLLIDENKEMALEYADKLLELITIKDAQWTNEWKKANNLIGGTDIDDVPYLALAFQERSHGIISYDKVFQKQGEVQTWNIQGTDKIISNYYSGVLSLVLVGSSTFLIQYLFKIIMLISKLILDFLLSIINIISFFIKKSIQTLARVPSFILLAAIALGIFFYHNNENFKKFIKELFTKGITSVHFLLTVIVDQIKDFYVLFEELVATLKPTLVTSFELIGYITMEYHLLMALVEDLEKKRPK